MKSLSDIQKSIPLELSDPIVMEALTEAEQAGYERGHVEGAEIAANQFTAGYERGRREVGEWAEKSNKPDKVYHFLAKNKRKSAVEMLRNDGYNRALSDLLQFIQSKSK